MPPRPGPSSEEPSRFEAVLASLAEAVSPAPDDAPPIAEAIRRFRERLPGVTHLGGRGDETDLYAVLEELLQAVKAAYPGSLCRSGCSSCCESQTAIFDASPAEWRAIETHLEQAWSLERRDAFLARFEAHHAPTLRALRWLARVRFFEPLADRYFARHPYRCPFLEDGRCSIYAARPLACRMFGYFAVRSRWYLPAAVYACRMQSDYLQGLRETGQALHLPAANTVHARFRRLAGGRGRVLPLWIARWRSALPRTSSANAPAPGGRV